VKPFKNCVTHIGGWPVVTPRIEYDYKYKIGSGKWLHTDRFSGVKSFLSLVVTIWLSISLGFRDIDDIVFFGRKSVPLMVMVTWPRWLANWTSSSSVGFPLALYSSSKNAPHYRHSDRHRRTI